MALEPGARGQSVSPVDSGRASPISRKWASRRNEEELLNKDKAFRRYASGVDRSLTLFETALQEWADYISFLGRLLKSLQAHPANVAVIPSKSIVARRLAQCMNPTLPSGVHQKALEVYNYIFSVIGKDALSRDLPLFLPGLSSTLSFASLTVRSPFLALLENYLLKLDRAALRPAMKAIVLALLPGLEEEISEDFDRTLKLLDSFKIAIQEERRNIVEPKHNSGDEYFWQCFFLASITSNSRRLGALAYLTRNLPRLAALPKRDSDVNGLPHPDLGAPSHQNDAIVTSPEPGLLLRCFAAGLSDDQVLIQRGFLDLLVTHLPLNAEVLQNRVKPEDLELLLTAAVGVVTRRDMSLNRRLWSWLLGPEPSSGIDSPTFSSGDSANPPNSSRTRYFEEYGLKPLSSAMLRMINREPPTPVERAKPFRLCLSLMDRWEIGGLVVPDIFLPAVKSVQKYQNQSLTKEDFMEVLRSASVFFDGVESGLIWGEIFGLIAASFAAKKATEAVGKLSLARFIITHFNVREEEMITAHIPTTALALLTMLEDIKAKPIGELLSTSDPVALKDISGLALNVLVDLIDLIPERVFSLVSSATQIVPNNREAGERFESDGEILEKIHKFYVQNQGNLDISPPPFPARAICDMLVRKAGKITTNSLAKATSSTSVAAKSRLLISLLNKTPKTDSLQVESLLSSIHEALSSSNQLAFSAFTSIISLVIILYPKNYISSDDTSDLVEPIVRLAWSYLSASLPKYHVETVRGLWQLQACLSLSDHQIEAAICKLITENVVSGTFSTCDANTGRSFAILWTHTLQDTAGYMDRRGSKTQNNETKIIQRVSGISAYEVMLGRPLFLLLDALLDEKTQLFVTVRTWLQSLVGIDKLFHLFVVKFSSFTFLQNSTVEQDDKNGSFNGDSFTNDSDFNQCLYYLQRLSSVLRWSSDATWGTLANQSVSTDKSHPSLHLITGRNDEITLQELFVHICLRAIAGGHDAAQVHRDTHVNQLRRTALSVMHQILLSPYSSSLSELHLEITLIERLHVALKGPDPFIQISLLDVLFAVLRLNALTVANRPLSPQEHKRPSTQGDLQSSKPPVRIDVTERMPFSSSPPVTLVKCLQAGFSAPSSRPVLDSWISFLSECLPFFSETIFQIIIPLVETICTEIEHTFRSLQTTFKSFGVISSDVDTPESTLISLLNGLEQVLARGHERLLKDEAMAPTVKSPEQPQGFFGNMVSGVFTSDISQVRSLTANNRLTVLLCFQDAVRICFMIWSWGGWGAEGSTQDPESVASFSYTSLRMRNRARRLLEHLFAAETLECLETVVEMWQKATKTNDGSNHNAVFNLLHVLDGSRPKHTIPAIFDAIYSRTNPSALEPSHKSTLTSILLDTDLVVFLVEYARSLEDDAMDEIWTDCMTFLKDILANPFPHRQTLPSLLEFAAILGEKVDNTNFGEQKRMRKELGDLFLRLLAATFTTKPMGFSDTAMQISSDKSLQHDDRSSSSVLNRSEDVVGILASITPSLPQILVEPERVLNAANTISANAIGPIFRSKAFPENVTSSVLVLLHEITRLPNTQKTWRKDLGDAFNDARFFSNPVSLLESNWLPLLSQWAVSDKERMPELLSRISPPTTAGIVFGVGATSARLESDRKTQLNLRRVATLILSATNDIFITEIKDLEDKLVELLSATTTSSPSSTTRGEIYMVLRALILNTSAIHLATLWPIINAEIFSAISSVVAPDHSQSSDTYNNFSILQACKLLDILLCIAPDDFQLHEWLFITDTIDAVYRPPGYHPVGLIDELSEELGSSSIASATYMEQISTAGGSGDKTMRRPLIGQGGVNCDDLNLDRKDELVGKILRPFFSQLSIFAFERTYKMGITDWDACRRDLLNDLFDERGVVKAL